VKRRGNQKEKFFSSAVPAGSPLIPFIAPFPTANPSFANTNFDTELAQPDGLVQDSASLSTYNSQWAEVAYFLLPVIDGTNGSNGTAPIGVPLYALFRSEFVVTPDTSIINWPSATPIPGVPIPAASFANYQGMSCNVNVANNIYFNSPSDLATTPGSRCFDPTFDPANAAQVAAAQRSTTLLMTDVLSFQVQVLYSGQYLGGSPPGPQPAPPDFADLRHFAVASDCRYPSALCV
jgi:hypothetical protein